MQICFAEPCIAIAYVYYKHNTSQQTLSIFIIECAVANGISNKTPIFNLLD